MSGTIKFRLAAFVLAIGGMVALIVWTALTSWQRIGDLSDRLTAVQLKSFAIADHLQETLLGLNNLVLRYGVYHDTNDWSRFELQSRALDRWIDDQRPSLNSEKEKRVLDLINTNYDDYISAARQIGAKVASSDQSAAPLAQFTGFEAQSHRILNLGIRLAMAHRESLDFFLADSNKSLMYLRALLLVSLALLLAAGAWLAAVVYRDLISPLQVKLVESQALVGRQEKLASLGMLAAGVAHEIRNPLTAIKAWLFLQQKRMIPGSEEHQDAEVIGREITHLENIVKDVLLFARPSEPNLTTVSADAPLREAQALLSPQLRKSGITLRCENSVEVNICVDPPQIKQVLINLVQNAADSIGKNGVVTMRVRLTTGRLAEQLRELVVLEVADNGRGIAPEVQKRLFDPFFTTKESGTGLGLCIAARIVEKHGGALQYQTQVNHGATFGVVLPRA